MELEEALEEIAQLKAKNADISRNFKAFRDSSEATQTELNEKLETSKAEYESSFEATKKELEETKKGIEEKETARRNTFMDKKFIEMSRGDKKIQESLKAEYALLNMPEDSEDAISSRLEKARLILNIEKPAGASEAAWAGSGMSWGDGINTGEISANTSALLEMAGVKF